jgi:hypothetical protein
MEHFGGVRVPPAPQKERLGALPAVVVKCPAGLSAWPVALKFLQLSNEQLSNKMELVTI